MGYKFTAHGNWMTMHFDAPLTSAGVVNVGGYWWNSLRADPYRAAAKFANERTPFRNDPNCPTAMEFWAGVTDDDLAEFDKRNQELSDNVAKWGSE